MHLVDRDRRLAVVELLALAHPTAILPDMARRPGHDRRSARWPFGPLGMRIGLQRQQFALCAEQLVLVEMAGTQPGHEDLPEPAGMTLAHRHAAAVPEGEIADQADPPRVRRPDCKRNAFDAVMHDCMCPELLVAGKMVALDEQMDIELAEHRRKAVDVVE